MSKAFIYILFWKNKSDLKNCLTAIKKNTLPQTYQLFIINDNPNLKLKLKNYCILQHTQNLGFTQSVNTALKHFKKTSSVQDHCIIMNNDIIPQKNWLTALAEAARQYPDTGILAATSLSMKNKNIVIGGGTRCPLRKNIFIPLNKIVLSGKKSAFKKNALSPFAEFATVLITAQCIIKTGFLNNKLKHFGSDVEYCFRALKKGFKTRYIAASQVLHKKQASLKYLSPLEKLQLVKDLKLLKKLL